MSHTPFSTGNSRSVTSRQTGIHQELAARVERYRRTPFRRPLARHSQQAFEEARRVVEDHGLPLILDSGCGVGDSSRALARQFSDHLVLGIDRSKDRLSRQRPDTPSNCQFIRANLVDFWRLAREAGWQFDRHYLLYPNPYPKPQHLTRRFHAHPVFQDLLALGGIFECRSNWRIYIDELQLALRLHGILAQVEQLAFQSEPLTAFERKYQASGQTLWRLVATIERTG